MPPQPVAASSAMAMSMLRYVTLVDAGLTSGVLMLAQGEKGCDELSIVAAIAQGTDHALQDP